MTQIQETQKTHEIHTSERRSFRACRLKWHWAYKEHLEPITGQPALQYGIVFHTGLQAVYEPKLWYSTTVDEKYEYALRMMTDVIEEQREKFLVATGQKGMLSPAYGDHYLADLELATAMLHYYVYSIHPEADNWFKPVRVEIPFQVPLYDPHDATEELYCSNSPHCGQVHPNPAPITFDGRVDALVEDLVNGGYWAVDWKTAASMRANDWFLHMEDQITGYLMALSLNLGIHIKGFLYAEIRKDVPKPPRILGKRHQGKLVSTDKRALTDYSTAISTIAEHDPKGYNAGLYDEYLGYLNSDDAPRFHQRFPILQSDRRLAIVSRNIASEALDMIDPDIRVYPEPAETLCRMCQFRQPCQAAMEGEDYQHALNTMYQVKEGR